jgi:hypothetical protein
VGVLTAEDADATGANNGDGTATFDPGAAETGLLGFGISLDEDGTADALSLAFTFNASPCGLE